MHPGDFTPVCTTELGMAAKMEPDFIKRGVKLCGFSCNDASSHKEWIKDIKAATGYEVDFPMFCDPDRIWSVDLGILDETIKDKGGLPLTVRSVYIIKPDRKIALMMTHPASTGRNFDEIFRCLHSVQRAEQQRVATPVNWKLGEDVIVDYSFSDAQADAKFGKNGYSIVEVPSEAGKKNLTKHYLRITKDPEIQE